MLRMVSYPRRPQSGHITCYLNRTYHVLPTGSSRTQAGGTNLASFLAIRNTPLMQERRVGNQSPKYSSTLSCRTASLVRLAKSFLIHGSTLASLTKYWPTEAGSTSIADCHRRWIQGLRLTKLQAVSCLARLRNLN